MLYTTRWFLSAISLLCYRPSHVCSAIDSSLSSSSTSPHKILSSPPSPLPLLPLSSLSHLLLTVSYPPLYLKLSSILSPPLYFHPIHLLSTLSPFSPIYYKQRHCSSSLLSKKKQPLINCEEVSASSRTRRVSRVSRVSLLGWGRGLSSLVLTLQTADSLHRHCFHGVCTGLRNIVVPGARGER